MNKINRKNIVSHLLDYELHLAGKKLVDTIDIPDWRFEFSITNDQYEGFRNYTIPLLKKVFKFNRQKAEATFEWFWKHFGIEIKNL